MRGASCTATASEKWGSRGQTGMDPEEPPEAWKGAREDPGAEISVAAQQVHGVGFAQRPGWGRSRIHLEPPLEMQPLLTVRPPAQRYEVTGGCSSGLQRLWSFAEMTEASPNVLGLFGAHDGACGLQFLLTLPGCASWVTSSPCPVPHPSTQLRNAVCRRTNEALVDNGVGRRKADVGVRPGWSPAIPILRCPNPSVTGDDGLGGGCVTRRTQ